VEGQYGGKQVELSGGRVDPRKKRATGEGGQVAKGGYAVLFSNTKKKKGGLGYASSGGGNWGNNGTCGGVHLKRR